MGLDPRLAGAEPDADRGGVAFGVDAVGMPGLELPRVAGDVGREVPGGLGPERGTPAAGRPSRRTGARRRGDGPARPRPRDAPRPRAGGWLGGRGWAARRGGHVSSA